MTHRIWKNQTTVLFTHRLPKLLKKKGKLRSNPQGAYPQEEGREWRK